MFSDLVGSTALAARMDPEDLRDVISAYQKCVAETVQRFGGFVAKYMGDGVLVYFGYPQAHEDDAERAVRAGLELIAAVSALNAASRLQTRVGIATGLVVVGDLIGTGSAQEQAVVGETPNLAARLQGIAEPDTRQHQNRPTLAERPDA
jgi:class 3 adenylate cyclase